MKKINLAALWDIRFKKVIAMEREGFLFYRRLFRRKEFRSFMPEMSDVLAGIAKDELRHYRLAKELMTILSRVKDRMDAAPPAKRGGAR